MKLWDAIASGKLDAVDKVLAKDTSDVPSAIQGLQNDALLEIQRRLLRENPPPHALSSALANAALSGSLALLRNLIAHPGALTPESGTSTLAYAARAGRIAPLRLLLEAGASPEHPSLQGNRNEDHPLTRAIENGDPEIVQALLDAGARLDFLIGYNDDRPLDHARKQGSQAVIDLLLAAGATPRTDADLSLFSAANFGRIARVQELLPDATEEDRGQALQMAAAAGHTEIVELLLAGPVPQKSLDQSLWFTAQNGHEAPARLLLARGASPEAESFTGRRALQVAAYKGHPKLVALLIQAGADVHARTEDGDNALDDAKGKPEIRALLIAAGGDPKAKQKLVAATKQQLKQFARPAWVPRVTSQKPTAFVIPHASRFGGLPWLAADEAWPVSSEGAPLTFILQINLDDAPVEARAQTGGGLLQLFFDVENQPYEPFSPGHLVRIVRSANLRKGGLAIPPQGLSPLPQKAITGWKQVSDTPFREAGSQPWHRYKADIPSEAEETTFKLNVKEDKLCGWPSWVQDASYPTSKKRGVELDRLLFQINSSNNLPVMFGDNGVGYILQASKAPDHVAFQWQSV
ncbi:ankyrin repeat domain-containing protein [Chondromyces apiculatus]|uniref:Uncharacterized protein n=1 Tax=Chondromyces apiculatus DSM 436 TaxID=1192034 RepID=A0A017TDW4_9BACT|nr:ankyrin repeat domain-containing protein [Chondromyces apiculatus]EYF07077.1 Hypothetical protein CAP_1008 [Chondromyces apiculatus DSM 436]